LDENGTALFNVPLFAAGSGVKDSIVEHREHRRQVSPVEGVRDGDSKAPINLIGRGLFDATGIGRHCPSDNYGQTQKTGEPQKDLRWS
jgi:hypothetical protein